MRPVSIGGKLTFLLGVGTIGKSVRSVCISSVRSVGNKFREKEAGTQRATEEAQRATEPFGSRQPTVDSQQPQPDFQPFDFSTFDIFLNFPTLSNHPLFIINY